MQLLEEDWKELEAKHPGAWSFMLSATLRHELVCLLNTPSAQRTIYQDMRLTELSDLSRVTNTFSDEWFKKELARRFSNQPDELKRFGL